MATISPSLFPESGQRKLSARETLQRAKGQQAVWHWADDVAPFLARSTVRSLRPGT